MIIALDYDDTYAADPRCFRAIIRCFQSCGHKVYIVTMRSLENDWNEEFDFLSKNYGVETIFCDGQSKRNVTESFGILVDVWIDDRPEGIAHDSTFAMDKLEKWRAEQIANGGIQKRIA